MQNQADIEGLIGRLTQREESSFKAGCKKCGYSGHLTFQCRNILKIDSEHDVVVDVSSTSSEESDSESLSSPSKRRRDKYFKQTNKSDTHIVVPVTLIGLLKARSRSLKQALQDRNMPRQQKSSVTPERKRRRKSSSSDASSSDSDEKERKKRK
ncbi:protein SREK1IP1-like, partial [Xenia sp. Carnegie-2017]|uniref:protein SREK1IP1-like n=1 Tax=Xenia sp. Carnegie-2017 TaxID=2897299 RepID=UPI001F044158